MSTEEKVMKQIHTNNIEFVRAEVADLNGISRGLTLDAQHFMKSGKNGIPIPASIVVKGIQGRAPRGMGFVEDTDGANTLAYPDYSSFRILPWLDSTATILIDYSLPHVKTPRSHCLHQLQELENLGLQLYSAVEQEFYLVDKTTKEPMNNDPNKMTLIKNNNNTVLLYDTMRSLHKVGMQPEFMVSEGGPGQFEITMSPKFGIDGIDDTFRFKHYMKEISLKHGYECTFMTKPYKIPVPPGRACASSAHFNHSLWSMDGSDNAMFDETRENNMSELAAHWIAGLQAHSKALMAFSFPTVNCYRAVEFHTCMPVNNTWGFENRTAAFRFKSYSKRQTYIENRMPSSACNPYLVAAAVIMAGMDGIKRKLSLSDAFCGDNQECNSHPDGTEMLPTSLKEAVDCLKEDDLFSKAFDGDFVKQFTLLKNQEMRECGKAKHDEELFQWEKEYYFTYI